MNINELFEEIQNQFLPEELRGEYLLHENAIIWSYNLSDDTEDLEEFDEDDEEFGFSFEASSSEELLLEAYREDLDKLNKVLDELEELDNWTVSPTDIVDEVIVFKIF